LSIFRSRLVTTSTSTLKYTKLCLSKSQSWS